MAATHESQHVTVRPRAAGVPADLGAPVLPSSKSHAQRALILAGLGAGSTTLTNVPDSEDVRVMAAAIEALGARIDRNGATWRVHAANQLAPARIDCRDNGTALRMLAMVVGLLGGRATFTGSARLQERPLDEARGALGRLGVRVGLEWPLDVDASAVPPRPERPVELAARTTSQVMSGAMLGLACARLRGVSAPGTVVVAAPIEASALYWSLTDAVLRSFGIRTHTRQVAPPQAGMQFEIGSLARRPPPGTYAVPGDASAATFVAALAAMHGLDVPDWPADDGHPDWLALAEIVSLATTAPPEPWRAHLLSLLPDSFPALCVVAASRPGVTELRGAPALRHKESDRVAAMAAGLRPLGVGCAGHDDGIVIEGRDLHALDAARPVALPAPRDHRVVMALSLLGSVVPCGVAVANPGAVDKSWPGFFAWLGRVADVTTTPD